MEEKKEVAEVATITAPGLTVRDLKSRVQLIQEVMRSVMKEGTHYGKIPGCPKPSLWKPGAEVLNMTFSIAVESLVENLSEADEKRYRVTCTAFSSAGVKLGSAVGECSSGEEKFKWRKPVCDQEWEESPVDRRREKWVKGYQGQPEKKIKQVRMESDDQANTILQMADKRAFVAVTRKVTAASDIFTQDIEDMEHIPEDGEATTTATPKPQPKKEAMDIAGFREITSKFAQKCRGCEGDIKVGDKAMYNQKIKGVYHPACLAPKEETPTLKAVTPAIIANLEKMAIASGTKLIDRIGSDGLQELDQIQPKYAEELLKEFAEIIDGKNQ